MSRMGVPGGGLSVGVHCRRTRGFERTSWDWKTNRVHADMALQGCFRGLGPWGCGPLGLWTPGLGITPGWPLCTPHVGPQLHCLLWSASPCQGSLLRGTPSPIPPSPRSPAVHPLSEPGLQLLEAFSITQW